MRRRHTDPDSWKNQEEPPPEPPTSQAEGLVECYQALDPDEARLLAARLSDHGIQAVADSDDAHDPGRLMSPGSRVRVRSEDLPRARVFLKEQREWLSAYKTILAHVERKELRKKFERYVLFGDLSDEEGLFDLEKTKLLLAGGGESNQDELAALTEDGRWVLCHLPRPGVNNAGVPEPARRAIQVEPADVSAWCLSDKYGVFDQRGQPVAIDGLPGGLTPTLHESRRITDWRQGLPVGERGQVRTGTDHSDEKGWIVGTRSELNKALGMSRKYSKYLEICQRKGVLEFKRSGAKFEIRLKNPERHREVEAELKRLRGV